MRIEIGQQAPDFTLYDTTRTKVSLSDLKGNNVLLLYFPQPFSRVCIKELCSVRDNIGIYNNPNATVLDIAVDSVFTLALSKKHNNMIFHY
jgi:peroxiredoxin